MAENIDSGVPVNSELVVPVRLSLIGTWELLRLHFEEHGIDISLLILELLRSVFGVEGIYGKEVGAYGIYKASRPETAADFDEQADVLLHEALQVLCDEITAVIPALQSSRDSFQYHYPNGPHVIFYLPVDASSITEEIRAKVIPKSAIHHLVR